MEQATPIYLTFSILVFIQCIKWLCKHCWSGQNHR